MSNGRRSWLHPIRHGLLALWLGLAAAALAAEPAPPKGLIKLDGRAAPELRLADMDGKATDLAHLRGRWVMVHFWAGWCGPCRKEMPTLVGMLQALPPERLTLLLVNTAETDDEVFSFLASVSMDLPSLMDRDGRVTERWQPRGLPSSFLVDPEGRLRYLALGGRDWASAPYVEFVKALSSQSPGRPKIDSAPVGGGSDRRAEPGAQLTAPSEKLRP